LEPTDSLRNDTHVLLVPIRVAESIDIDEEGNIVGLS
jgi:hypothetical protein